MIRTLIVDDHPAVRNGLVASLRVEPGVVPVGAAGDMADAVCEAERTQFDVALVDYHLGDGDGLALCHELERLPSPPAVLIYSAFAGSDLVVGAAVAGAAGVVDKGAPLDTLFDAIRTVARGGRALPPLRHRAYERTASRLNPDDLPILGMRIDGAKLPEIASVLRLSEDELSRRIRAMIGRFARYKDSEARLGAAAD